MVLINIMLSAIFLFSCKTANYRLASSEGDATISALNAEEKAGFECAIAKEAPEAYTYSSARSQFGSSLRAIDHNVDQVVDSLETYRSAREKNDSEAASAAKEKLSDEIRKLREFKQTFLESVRLFQKEKDKMIALASTCELNKNKVIDSKAFAFEAYKDRSKTCTVTADFPTRFWTGPSRTGLLSFTQEFCNETFWQGINANVDYSKLNPNVRQRLQNLKDSCKARGSIADSYVNMLESFQAVERIFCNQEFEVSYKKNGGTYVFSLEFPDLRYKFKKQDPPTYYWVNKKVVMRDTVTNFSCSCKDSWSINAEELRAAMPLGSEVQRIRSAYAKNLKDVGDQLLAYLTYLENKTQDVEVQIKSVDDSIIADLRAQLEKARSMVGGRSIGSRYREGGGSSGGSQYSIGEDEME